MKWIVPILVLAALLLSACNLGPPGQPDITDEEMVAAIAGATIAALQTEQAALWTPTEPVSPPTATLQPTATLAPSRTPLPSPTRLPTLTLIPSATPLGLLPSRTPVPTRTTAPPSGGVTGGSGGAPAATATSTACNAAALVAHVTIPEGTEVNQNSQFRKIWRVRNTGRCSWSDRYELRFDGGEDMGEDRIQVGRQVRPGETVDLGIDMVAPERGGRYSAEWMLRSADGEEFGLGGRPGQPLTVSIRVQEESLPAVYDFVANACAAQWRSRSGELGCPGNPGEDEGAVVVLNNPALETRGEDEPALGTFPEEVENGFIRGVYPPFEVRAGDRFLADVGCLAGYPRCEVLFQVHYQIAGQSSDERLGQWQEIYDQQVTRVDLDLSPLAGQRVHILLTVNAGQNPRDDAGFWLVPRIVRPSGNN